MGHAYASTEAGVGFEVTDGLEGFPAAYLDRAGPVEMKIVDGTLRIRSPRAASRYVGGELALVEDGWVDTGDMVERRGDRCYFAGRRGGIINVGGLKINPGGSGSGDQPPSRRARCRAYRAAKTPSPAPSWWPMWCCAMRPMTTMTFKRGNSGGLSRRHCRPSRCRPCCDLCRKAGTDRGRKAGAPCVMFWLSAAAPAAWAWPLRKSWPADGFCVFALAPQGKRRPERRHRGIPRRRNEFRALRSGQSGCHSRPGARK